MIRPDPVAVRDVSTEPGSMRTMTCCAARNRLPIWTNVADGAMEFTLYVYVASPRLMVRVKSELLFAIVPELAGRGIDLANSTPIVNVGFRDKPIETEPQTPIRAPDVQGPDFASPFASPSSFRKSPSCSASAPSNGKSSIRTSTSTRDHRRREHHDETRFVRDHRGRRRRRRPPVATRSQSA